MSALAFLSPWILVGLLALPLLWWLLRATPPSPKHLKFPGVQLLLGLRDVEKMPNRTPIWLLILRMLAVAAAIIAFAEPELNPQIQSDGNGPLLVLMDGGWASAPDWNDRVAEAENLLEQAARAGRPTVFASLALPLSQGEELPYKDARDWLATLRGLEPQAWAPDREAAAKWIADKPAGFETYWLTDRLQYSDDTLAEDLVKKGNVRLLGTATRPLALYPLELADGRLQVTVVGLPDATTKNINATAFGTSPNGVEVAFGTVSGQFPATETTASLTFDLPLELTNRVTRVVLGGESSAAAVALADDGARRLKVGLIGTALQQGPQLVGC